MKHKRSRKTASGSKGSVDSGSSLVAAEHQIANKPPPPEQEVEGSRSDQDRGPTDGAVAGEEGEQDGDVSSSDIEPPPSANSPVVSQEDDDEEESPDKGNEVDMQPQRMMKRSRSNDAPGPNPQPNKKKRDTTSHQPEVPALDDQEAEDEGPHSSKEIRPESAHQPGERGAWFGKEEKVRRVWYNKDELLILTEINKFLLEHQRLPELKDNDFFESVLEQLEDDSCVLRNVKDKMKSLKRRYDAHVISTTDHERLLDNLSEKIWGPRGSNIAGSKNEDKSALVEAEKNFGEVYPLLTQEVMLIADEQASAKSLCIGLDAETALSIEKRLERIKEAELKIQKRMEAKVIAPKAMIRKKLVGLAKKVSKKVRSR